MNERTREIGAAILAGVLVLAGLLTEVAADEVEPATLSTPADDPYVERAAFCPPQLRESDVVATAAVAGASDNEGSVTIGADGAARDLSPQSAIVSEMPDANAFDVVGYGTEIGSGAIGTYSSPVSGTTAAGCSSDASDIWYFPEGSSLLDFNERLQIYNPFPEEAVVRVLFFTPHGEKALANLSDVAVPAGEWTSVNIEEFITEKTVLSAEISAVRGRVVAWRTIDAEPEGRPDGVYSTLGSMTPSTLWYLPDGAVGPGYDERITILNPSDEEALVTVSLLTGEEVVQPRRLSEVAVPARSTILLKLSDRLGEKEANLGGVSAVVQTSNGTEIVVERTTWYTTARLTGVSSEIGLSDVAKSWIVAPATVRPDTDVIYVMNAGDDARVSISLLKADGTPVAPEGLQNLRIGGGLRLKIPIAGFTDGRPMVALVTSDAEIAVERSSYDNSSGDVASIVGTPID